MTLQRCLLRTLVALALAVGAGTPSAQGTDADFLAGQGGFDRGDRAARALAPAQRPCARALRRLLATQAPASTSRRDAGGGPRLPHAWPDTPLADRVRVDWLKASASGATGARFAIDYAAGTVAKDIELACYAHPVRSASATASAALAAAKPLWFTGQATPDACEPLFAALIARGTITRRPTAGRASASPSRPATCASRRQIAGRPARQPIASTRANSRTSTRSRRRTLAQERDSAGSPATGASSRSTRSSGPRAADAAGARAAWLKWRDRPARSRPRVGQRAARLPRVAPAACRAQRRWFREAACPGR